MKAKLFNKEIVVGMSGGVDSSISLILLKKQGWQPVGVSLKYATWFDPAHPGRENICCSAESFQLAEKICQKLNVSHYIFDVSREFKREVINYFISELKCGRTPNPCIICNRYLKFKKLFVWAKQRKIKKVATGHYARIKKDFATQKYELRQAKDKKKDQTYSLSFLPEKWLKDIIFPLGDYTKEEVYQIAKKEGLNIFSKRKQSQDFCFVAGKSFSCFLEREIGRIPGLIKDVQGNVLGKHQGLHFYTLGQRKGLELSNGPFYVLDKNPEKNILKITRKESDLFRKELLIQNIHWISIQEPKFPLKIKAKIRSQHQMVSAILNKNLKSKTYQIIFKQPVKAAAPGQFVVFYRRNVCLGNGLIDR